ncbi:hypothetical protein D1007_47819 [Hordeum vulgare]|nr:hypothetical protein D1007_47819 [Hordeum vulgare]
MALPAVLCDSEEEVRRRADKEAAYQQQPTAAIALSAAGNCVMPPSSKPEPTEPQPREVYQWTGIVSGFVSASPIWLGATRSRSKPTSSTGGRSTCGRSASKAFG